MKCFCLFVLLVLPVAHLFAQEDCDVFNIQDLSAAYLNFSVESIILQPDGSHEVHLSNGTTYTMVLGCMDPVYLEYDATANTDDGSCATFVIIGCTDPAYGEYNAYANTDDGSCTTLAVNGCMNPVYLEYDATANQDDGSCATFVIIGCTDPAYGEYNAYANTDDGSCATFVINGCMDQAYVEYDATANTDDGSCATFVINGCTDPAYVEYNACANTDDGSCVSLATLGSSCASPTMDGYSYSVVEIGDQCWFSENLRTTVYADDSAIPEDTLYSSPHWFGLSTGARCDYDYDVTNVATYGRLYNWYAATDAAGLCPCGWHVPTDGEWTDLENYITSQGFSGTEGTALKSTAGWVGGGNGTDNFGFSALPGGGRVSGYGFYFAGGSGSWWSSSPSSPGDTIYPGFTAFPLTDDYTVVVLDDEDPVITAGTAWYRTLWDSDSPVVNRDDYNQRGGFSVRCLRDAD